LIIWKEKKGRPLSGERVTSFFSGEHPIKVATKKNTQTKKTFFIPKTLLKLDLTHSI